MNLKARRKAGFRLVTITTSVAIVDYTMAQEDKLALQAAPELLANVPDSIARNLRRGLAVLMSLPEESVTNISRLAVRETVSSLDVNPERFAQSSGVALNIVQEILPAATTLLSIVGSRSPATAGELTHALVVGGYLPENDAPKAEAGLEPMIAARHEIERVMKGAEVANATMPSFSGITSSVDVRLAFEEQRVTFAVPVAMIRMVTDIEGGDLFFQAKLADVRYLANYWNGLVNSLEQAEKWMSQR